MKRKGLLDLATGALVLSALVVTGATVRREFLAPTPPAVSRASTEINWAAYVEGGHILGDKGARVTIVEFADFECP
ncbi:MAG: hypothetical protein ACT4OZ_16620, partial [Gemmatimonadota bacterium]